MTKKKKLKKGLGIILTLKSLKNSFQTFYQRILEMGFSVLIDISYVFLFYGLLWFIFAPRIHNALSAIMESGQIARDSANISAMIQFESDVGNLLVIVLVFLIVLAIFWCIMQGYNWYFASKFKGDKKKTLRVIEYLARFSILTAIFLVPIMTVTSICAKLSFNFLGPGQLIVLGICLLIDLGLLHLLNACYSMLFINSEKKDGIFMGTFYDLRDGLYVGTRYLFGYVSAYLIFAALFAVIDLVLRLAGMINFTFYIGLGLILVFPVFSLFRISMINLARTLSSK